MGRKIKLPRILLFSMMIGIILTISIGLSIWLITEQVIIKPELDVDKVIINYLDDKEAFYNSNILLPSNKALGLSIENDELTYSYKLKSSDEDFVEVDVNNKKGPIDVGIYIIEVVYTTPTYDSEGKVNGSKSVTKELDFEIKPRDISTAAVTFNRTAGNKFDLGMSLDKFTEKMNVELSINEEEIKEKLTLERNKDYSCDFPVINQTGTFIATITGTGNFIGTATVEYIIQNILVINISKEFNNYDSSGNYYYFSYRKYNENTFPLKNWISVKTGSGEEVTSKLTFKYKYGTEEYKSLSFDDVLSVKEYTIKIIAEAEGFSSAETEIKLAIEQASLHDAVITLEKDEFVFDNTSHTPAVLSVVLNGEVLTAGSDYTLFYDNNIDANVAVDGENKTSNFNKAKVKAIGCGNYNNFSEKTFDILQAATEITNPIYAVSGFIEGVKPVEQTRGYATVVGKSIELAGTVITDMPDNVEFGKNRTLQVPINYTFIPSDSNSNGISNYQQATSSSTLTMYAVAYIGDIYYGTVAKALEKAVKNNIVYVIPNLKDEKSGNLYEIFVNEPLSIGDGITLCLPYSDKLIKTSNVEYSTLGSTIADSNDSLISTNRSTLLNLRDKGNIVIEVGGKLQIGGVYNKIGVVGSYSEINLGVGTSITVKGELLCYGYIKEDYSNASNSESSGNSLKDNSNDIDRYLKVTNDATLKTVLAVKDGTGGGTVTSLTEAGSCPVSENDFPCLQTYTIFEHGCNVTSYARVSAAQQDLEREIAIIRKKDSKDTSLFYSESGTIVFEYIPKNAKYTLIGANNDKTYIIFRPGTIADMGSLYLDITVATIDTTKMFFPVSYKFHVFIQSESVFRTSNQMKFMPGSKLVVEENGKLELDSSLIIYKNSDMSIVGSEDGIYYPKNAPDAILINDGTIELSANGKIGGYIQHTNTNDTASINLESVSQGSLTVSAPEGINKKEVIIPATGDFSVDSELVQKPFAAGQTLTSVYSTKYYWNGNYYDQAEINVIISENNYENPVFNYTIMVADDSNGTNGDNLSAKEATDGGKYKAILDKYIKFTVNREFSSFIDFGNGPEELNEDIWYLINSNITLTIIPNEGVKVSINTSGNSGAGKVNYTVYESIDEGKTWSTIGTTSIGKITVNVIKNAQFKFTTQSSYGYYFTTKPYYKGDSTTKSGVHGTENSSSSSATALGNNTIYIADDDYRFEFGWNFQTCIAEGTLITLANGSKVPVEQLIGNELLLVWNHTTGRMDYAKIAYIVDHDKVRTEHEVITMNFNDGTNIKIIGEHVFYDATLNKYVAIDSTNYSEYIGHKFLKTNDNNNLVEIEFISATINVELTRTFEVVTDKHLINFTNDILSTSAFLDPLLNVFDINPETYAYNIDQMMKDIEEYGLYTYDDFEGLIDEKAFELYNAAYLKVAVGKGYITWDDIIELINIYYDVEVKPLTKDET